MGGIADLGESMDNEAAWLGISPNELAEKVHYSPVIKVQ